jgi:ArsR family transcriptional regulator
MDLIRIYECFCDQTRLRILSLLGQTPLCVCHFQTILDETQVKISKHLSYLKSKGLVEAQRHQNWMIYSLPTSPPAELEANLKCLQDCVQTHPVFKNDLKRLKAIRSECCWVSITVESSAAAASSKKKHKKTEKAQ